MCNNTYNKIQEDTKWFTRGMCFFPAVDSPYAVAVDNPPFESGIIRKNRPLLVISNSSEHSIVTVIPISTDNNANNGDTSYYENNPYYVPFTRRDGTPSIICVPQIKPCPVSMLGEYIYMMSSEIMAKVDVAIARWTGILCTTSSEVTSLKDLTSLISSIVDEEVHKVRKDSCPISVSDIVSNLRESIHTTVVDVTTTLPDIKPTTPNNDGAESVPVAKDVSSCCSSSRKTRTTWPEFSVQRAQYLNSIDTATAMREFNAPNAKMIYSLRYQWNKKLNKLENN